MCPLSQETLLRTQLEELEAQLVQLKKGHKVRVKSEAKAAGGAGGKAGSAAAGDDDDGDEAADPKKAEEDAVKKLALEEGHLFTRQPSTDDVAKRITVCPCSALAQSDMRA